jgi:VWFA-related protein
MGPADDPDRLLGSVIGSAMDVRFRFAPLIFCFCAVAAQAQSQPPNQAPANQPYTIQADSRVVLTDVTVTDRNGNPVHGLPESAFHILDDNKPQPIATFEEHAGTPAVKLMPAVAPGGAYSNGYLLQLPLLLNVVIIDIANLGITEQMYLYYELTKFFSQQPEGQPLALYLRAGNGCFLVQNFTSDRALLSAALRRAIPRIPPTGREYLSDIDTLQQMAVYLSQLRGRKNILWFSGGSTAYLRDDAQIYVNSADWRALYDELERERIAVYPIDARGLTIRSGPNMWAQQGLMSETARATGGKAFFNNNGLTEIATHVLSSDGSFYTLTYSPHDFHFDNKWHKVRVTLNEEGYELSYRRGYFADGSAGGAGAREKTGMRTRLLPDGQKVQLPETHSLPIIFQAQVLPTSGGAAAAAAPLLVASKRVAPTRRGTVPFLIHYSLPMGVFTPQAVDGKSEIVFGVAAVVLNRDGSVVDKHAERVTMTRNEDVLRIHPEVPFGFDQQVNLEKDDDYLYLAVWDMTSGRLGTLQIPLQIPKPAK